MSCPWWLIWAVAGAPVSATAATTTHASRVVQRIRTPLLIRTPRSPIKRRRFRCRPAVVAEAMPRPRSPCRPCDKQKKTNGLFWKRCRPSVTGEISRSYPIGLRTIRMAGDRLTGSLRVHAPRSWNWQNPERDSRGIACSVSGRQDGVATVGPELTVGKPCEGCPP